MYLTKSKAVVLAAEFLGSGILAVAALLSFSAQGGLQPVAVAATVAVVAMAFARFSGAHTNPAVTIGMWTARKIDFLTGVTYVIAQMLGGLAAWRLFEYLTQKKVEVTAVTHNMRTLVAVLVGSAIFTYGYMAYVERKADSAQTAASVGLTFFVGVFIASTASYGLINPVMTLGVRAWSVDYVLGAVLGGVVGVNLFNYMATAVASKKK